MPNLLSIALKEWDLQVRALLRGEQAFLLRKGGILEAENEFQMEHPRFLFFPTFIHQDSRMVRAPWRPGIKNVREEPAEVEIAAYGEVAEIFEVPSRSALESLSDLYIWDTPLLDMRFAYRPEKPLYLAVIRAFALEKPVIIPNTIAYAGCKSWVPLETAIEVDSARPALTDAQLQTILDRVKNAFSKS